MAAAQYFDQVQKIFIAFYQRPADPAGLKYWASRVDAAGGDISQVINAFATSPEATDLYGTIDADTIGDVVDAIYMALFNVVPDAAGKAFYVDGFADGTFTAGTIALAVLNGAQNDDLIALNNKVEAANEFTAQVDGRDMTDPAFGSGTAFNATYEGEADAMAARDFLAGIGSDPATIPNASQITDVIKSDIADMGDPILEVDTSGNMLTTGQDTILGTAEGQTYSAPVVQNQNGAATNTLGDGDVIAGIGMDNKLTVDLVLTTSGAIPVGSAISAATNNIQVVELRAQTINLDVGGPHLFTPSHIDAEKMVGVQEWWSVNSRSGLQVEDVRSRPEDTTIGMRDTDPEVGFRVYFDPDQLDENIRTEDSALTLNIADVANPGDLSGVPIDGLSFMLDGVSYTLRSDDIGAATTYAELLAGLLAELALQPALATVSATLNPDNTITLLDSAGKPFTLGSWFFVNDSVPANGNIVFQQTVGDPSLVDVPVATNVVLDNVGRTSPGGDLDIGSLGDGGVAQFDVVVDRASWVTSMQSNSHLNDPFFFGPIQTEHLETVNFTSTGAKGNVTVGERFFDLDGRVYDGLVDVREVDGSAFMGKMNLGISLNQFGGGFLDGSSARYLDGATGPVEFSYKGSAQADTFNIFVDSAVSDDPDFRMDVDMGAADDRLILSGADNLNNISVDGGTGNNTFVTSTSVGVGANPADIADHQFASFKNFQNYEIEGGGATAHDFTTLTGVTSVVVATNGFVDTTLIDLPVANVILSGKNQTIGANSNDDQDFGTIDIQGADAATMTVTLQNTARVDGELYVDELEVSDFSATNQSAVRTLNIVSNGARQTTNAVDHIHAERVNTFNFSGTQDLFADIKDAANSNGPLAGITNLVANGSALTGSFDLEVDSQIVTAVDAAGKTATFTGTAGATDRLTFDGAITATANTMVTGFETVSFKDSSGNFDASGVSGVTLYDVDSLNGDLNLNHLRSTETVQINTDPAEANADNMFTFATEAAASSSSLQLNFLNTDDPSVAGDLNFSAPGDGIATKGFTTVNMNLGGAAGNADFYLFDLMFQDNAGLVRGDVGFDFAKVAAKNLVVTGGQASAANLGDGAILGLLSATLKVIDFSGYKGSIAAALDNAFIAGDSPSAPTAVSGNTLVKVNGFSMFFNDADHTVNDTITTFEFTTDAVSATQDWVIGNFMGENDVAGSLSNVTILDMSDLNVNGLVDLIQTQVGGDVHITSNEGLNFEIVLVGTNLADVGLANFQFAA